MCRAVALWGFVSLIVATHTASAGSFSIDWLMRRRTTAPSSWVGCALTQKVHLTTLALVVLTVLFAPPLVAVEVMIGPIG